MSDFMHDAVQQLKDAGLFRSFRSTQSPSGESICINGRTVLNMCSNNYLGLAHHPEVVSAAAKAMEQYGFGSGASRFVSGNMEVFTLLEEALAAFKNTEAALFFNSGYAANTGIIPALVGHGDAVYSDRLNHASIIDGIRLSGARHFRYAHRDSASLASLLQKGGTFRRRLIVSDSVFSMDGDLAPLQEICSIKQQYDAMLMIDEAHGSGIFGEQGRGLAEAAGVSNDIDINMGTLGKAFGCAGAYAAGSRVLIDYLRNNARTQIYTTALPPAVPAGVLAALGIARREPERRRRLLDNAAYVRNALKAEGFDTLQSESQIIPILTGKVETALEYSSKLFDAGVFISAIRPPTVPAGTARLRLTIMATHTQAMLDQALSAIIETGKKLKVLRG